MNLHISGIYTLKRDIRKTTAIELGLLNNTPQISLLFMDNGFMSEPEGEAGSEQNYVQLWHHGNVSTILHGLDEA